MTLGRTSIVHLGLAATMLGGLFACLHVGTEQAASMFSSLAWALAAMGGTKAVHGAVDSVQQTKRALGGEGAEPPEQSNQGGP